MTKKRQKTDIIMSLTLVSLYLDGETQRNLARNWDMSRSNVYYHIHKLDDLEDFGIGDMIAERAKGRKKE